MELQRLSGCSTTSEALETLGLIPNSHLQFDLCEIQNWQPGGAETYTYRFSVTYQDGNQHIQGHYIFKACIAYSIIRTVEDILADWLSRRRLVERAGASVPRLITSGGGLILEEFVPYSLSEALGAFPGNALPICESLATLAGALTTLGFLPLSVFSDLRSRGTDVVAIDFGQDLGGPGQRRQDDALFADLLDKLGHLVPLTPGLRLRAHQAFERSLARAQLIAH